MTELPPLPFGIPIPPVPPPAPPPTPPAVDQQLLLDLLRRVERVVDRRGWDQPPRFYLLYETGEQPDGRWVRSEAAEFADGIRTAVPGYHLGDAVTRGRYAAQMMTFEGAVEGHPRDALKNFATSVAYAAGRHFAPAIMRNALRKSGALGIAVTTESYTLSGITQQERDAMGDVSFADVPQARESREITAVTWDRRAIMVHRERGAPDDTVMLDDVVGGMVVLWLRLLCAAVLDEVPPTTEVLKRWPKGFAAGSETAQHADREQASQATS